METKPFFLKLLLLTACTSAVLVALHLLVPAAQAHAGFAVAAVALFVLICVGLFYLGRNAAQSKNKLAFNNVISLSVFGKMLASIGALFIYQKTAQPANEWFVAIFLLTYVVYTVFEVWFMTKLAKA